ncbi:MAG: single-stranded-DNA-specific exonuclease RecJ [Parvularculaceae bacterium]
MTALALPTLAEAEAEWRLPLPAMGATASGKPWRLRPVDAREALAIAQIAEIDLPAARVLAARGVKAEGALRHLNPSLRTEMPDPFVLQDMERAAERMARAVHEGERIGVFGDYDVDGTTAAAMLKIYFDQIGVPVSVYLPDRIAEGYGPNIEAFRSLAREGARLIVTVDCGAAAHSVIEEAARDGLDIVVLDHHLMAGPPPAGAVAVVNPNRLDDVSGLANLSAASVAFMALVALNRRLRQDGWFAERTEPDLRRLLDLAALGLVCDVMELKGLARAIVAQGLKVLGARTNAGLAALAERCGVKGAPSTYHLGFLLGPRINAAGRIGHARLALELLTTRDDARQEALADQLHRMNAERQEIEREVFDAALAKAIKSQESVVVVSGEGWHQGVIGIVAGRLKEALDRPAVVIATENGVGKGSGRSIEGVDLGAAVNAARAEGLIEAGGGHAMAAGLTVSAAKIDQLAEYLERRLETSVTAALAARRLDIDAVAAASAVTQRFSALIERAGPFGRGNPEPCFALLDMRASGVKAVGKDHLACTLVSAIGEQVRAIAFRCDQKLTDVLKSGRRFHVAGKIRADDFRGGAAAQFQIVDAAESEPA